MAIADILEHPEQYFGQELTLSGEVSETLSSRVFRIAEAHDGLLANLHPTAPPREAALTRRHRIAFQRYEEVA